MSHCYLAYTKCQKHSPLSLLLPWACGPCGSQRLGPFGFQRGGSQERYLWLKQNATQKMHTCTYMPFICKLLTYGFYM